MFSSCSMEISGGHPVDLSTSTLPKGWSSREHLSIASAEAIQLVRDYMLFPEDHMKHPKRFGNSITNSIGFDPQVWTDRETFMPERCADHPLLAPECVAGGDWQKRDHFGYGAGRRICPGM